MGHHGGDGPLLRRRWWARATFCAALLLPVACGGNDSTGTPDTSPPLSADAPDPTRSGPTPSADADSATGATDGTPGVPAGSTDGEPPCLSCPQPPPQGVAQQLGYFGGGASPPECEEIHPADQLYAGVKFGTDVERGTHRYFCLTGARDDVPVSVEITLPDGSTVNFDWWADGGDQWWLDPLDSQNAVIRSRRGQVVWPFRAAYPLGEYVITASQPPDTPDDDPPVQDSSPDSSPDSSMETVEFVPVTSTTRFTVAPAGRPRVQATPPQRFDGEPIGDRVYRPGDTVRFMLSGFAPGASIVPLVYSSADGDACPEGLCFSTALPPVNADAAGMAEVRLTSRPQDAEGLYCLTTGLDRSCEPFSSGGDAGFGGEFFLGPPF